MRWSRTPCPEGRVERHLIHTRRRRNHSFLRRTWQRRRKGAGILPFPQWCRSSLRANDSTSDTDSNRSEKHEMTLKRSRRCRRCARLPLSNFVFGGRRWKESSRFLNCWNMITPTSFNWHCLWASSWLTTCGERKLADWKIGRRSSRLFHKNFNNWERG